MQCSASPALFLCWRCPASLSAAATVKAPTTPGPLWQAPSTFPRPLEPSVTQLAILGWNDFQYQQGCLRLRKRPANRQSVRRRHMCSRTEVSQWPRRKPVDSPPLPKTNHHHHHLIWASSTLSDSTRNGSHHPSGTLYHQANTNIFATTGWVVRYSHVTCRTNNSFVLTYVGFILFIHLLQPHARYQLQFVDI